MILAIATVAVVYVPVILGIATVAEANALVILGMRPVNAAENRECSMGW